MGKEFKNTDFVEPHKACELTVELCRKPRTQEEWNEWEAEFEKSMADGDFYTGEEFIKIMKEEYRQIHLGFPSRS